MESGIFTDNAVRPNKQMLIEALGNSFKYWKEIRKSLEKDFGEITEEWKFFGKNTWWVLKLLYRGRNLLFLTPCDRYFRATFILGDKEVSEIENSDLPKDIITQLKGVKKFIEGRGFHITIRMQSDVRVVLKIAVIKMKNQT